MAVAMMPTTVFVQGAGAVASQGFAGDTSMMGRRADATDSVDPFNLKLAYSTNLSDQAKFMACMPGFLVNPVNGLAAFTGAPLCNIICWNKLKSRSYIAVYENRIEANYPTTAYFGFVVQDAPWIVYFDRLGSNAVNEPCCTPWHCCLCIPCAGQIAAYAPNDAINNCFFNFTGTRMFLPGLLDAPGFANAANQAKAGFIGGMRAAPGQFQGTAPIRVGPM